MLVTFVRSRALGAADLARLLVRHRHRQGFDLQLTQYDEKGWHATFYTTGMEHSPTRLDRNGMGVHAVDSASRVGRVEEDSVSERRSSSTCRCGHKFSESDPAGIACPSCGELGGKKLLYGCHTSRTCGTSVCANRLQADVIATDRAVLGMLESVVLDPPTAARIVREAITRLSRAATMTDTDRTKLEKALRTCDAQIARLTSAIADGGGSIPSLVQKLKTTEAERGSVIDQLAKLEAHTQVQGLDVARLEAVIAAKVANWRGVLDRHPIQARQILSKLLTARLVFTPVSATQYQITGAASASVLLGALVPATPINDRSKGTWPQRDSNPCFRFDHISRNSRLSPDQDDTNWAV